MYGPGRNREAVTANERSEYNFCSMQITQEVRDFAAKQSSESYLAAATPVENADEGMDEMAEKNRDGGDLYVKAAD